MSQANTLLTTLKRWLSSDFAQPQFADKRIQPWAGGMPPICQPSRSFTLSNLFCSCSLFRRCSSSQAGPRPCRNSSNSFFVRLYSRHAFHLGMHQKLFRPSNRPPPGSCCRSPGRWARGGLPTAASAGFTCPCTCWCASSLAPTWAHSRSFVLSSSCWQAPLHGRFSITAFQLPRRPRIGICSFLGTGQ